MHDGEERRLESGGRLKRVFIVALAALLAGACQATGPIGTAAPESATPEPTASDTQAVESPALTFAMITKSGRGSKVVKFTIPADAPAIATLTNKGSSNFVVESLAADGSTNALLVNEIGAFGGTVLFDANAGEHSVALKIESDGTWTLAIKPVSAARTWSGTGTLTGKGKDVVQLSPASSGLTTVRLVHRGTSNFAIQTYGVDGSSDLIVNEIGHYDGETTLGDGTDLLVIDADGAWSVTVTG